MNKVKEICIRQGITPKELAAKVGVSQPTVSDWFNNKKNPSGSRLTKLSEVFGVSRSVILGLDDLPSTENTDTKKEPESAEFEKLWDRMTPKDRSFILHMMRKLDEENQQ